MSRGKGDVGLAWMSSEVESGAQEYDDSASP